MKRVNNIYNKICDIDVIMDMYDKVIKTNTKNKKKIQNFENFYSCNIAKIKETLITKSYVPEKYNIFLVKEPKTRKKNDINIISSASNSNNSTCNKQKRKKRK